ncbi:MAG: aminotransferase class V-fold PLP-dependent enzyme [Christensenellaceae bacterium]
MITPIIDMLETIIKGTKARFCMPGHKGKQTFLNTDISGYDITEIDGADNLYMPSGVIEQSQTLYAKEIGATRSFFMVNGSSCGVQASVLSVIQPKEKILVARDFHLSAVNAFVFADAQPVFFSPSATNIELPCVITPNDVRSAIRENPDAKALYVTYPNYYGLCCDLTEICRIAHDKGLIVICDGAHSACFDFSDLLPVSPAQAGCDIWTASLHKTLLAMNQCAVLSIGQNISQEEVQSKLNMLQTTSPSYLLLGSCDYALAVMRESGKQRIEQIIAIVEENIRKIESLGGYKCVLQDAPKSTGAFDRDILKLVIDVTDRGVSGFGVAKLLAAQGVYVEAADLSNIILICSIADNAQDFEKLREILKAINGSNYNIHRTMHIEDLAEVYRPQLSMNMRQAALGETRVVALFEAIGEVAAVSAGAYPPGIPIIVTGQIITREMVDYLTRLRNTGYSIFGCDGSIKIVNR